MQKINGRCAAKISGKVTKDNKSEEKKRGGTEKLGVLVSQAPELKILLKAPQQLAFFYLSS